MISFSYFLGFCLFYHAMVMHRALELRRCSQDNYVINSTNYVGKTRPSMFD
jgi:hypothetical protein